MPVAVAFLDASVLYPAPLRDVLLELAVLRRVGLNATVEEILKLKHAPDL